MVISKSFINDFTSYDDDPRSFAEKMTMTGSKVETYDNYKNHIKNVVIGKILEIEKHPDADKLVICKVDIAKDAPLQIVTGATNLKVGDIVPVALDSSELPNGAKIKKGKLRGVLSEGMLCSLGELSLTTHDFPDAIEDGIFVITEDVKIGQPFESELCLDDDVFDFEITPNRPDCLSAIGIAREVSATYNTELNIPTPTVKNEDDEDISNYLEVEVKNTDLCKRYSARVVKNVKIAPSPLWLRNRLSALGVRPINNIVDITNYVMLEYGQPMHAFDYSCLDGKKIIVRTADDNEDFVTLDDEKRVLDKTMLVIADKNKSVAIAGVMGGANSEIKDTTTTVVFESANFNGASVRKTSKKLGFRTDASSRFEKGLDPQMTIDALQRACQLVEELGAGTVTKGIIDINNDTREAKKIELCPEWINKFLGIDIDKDFMINALEKLQFKVENDIITVPSFRDDVEHKADIAEEIVRMYGYDKIPSTLVNMPTTQGVYTPMAYFKQDIAKALLGLGYSEIMTYSFQSPKLLDKLEIKENSVLRNYIKISNPLGEDTSIMRTTSLGSMLNALSQNYNKNNQRIRFFEIASIYIKNNDIEELPDEQSEVVLGGYGDHFDFYKLKGAIEQMFASIGLNDVKYTPCTDNDSLHPSRTALISYNDVNMGYIGQVHPNVANNFSLNQETYVAVISVEKMFAANKAVKEYRPLPKFPSTTRDLAVVCKKEMLCDQIITIIKDNCCPILESVELFDIYTGAQIEKGYKSLAFSLSFRAADRTLSDSDVDAKMKKVIKSLDEIGAKIRS